MAAALTLFAVTSCEKEGPAGPQGEPGPQGEQGPKGEQGAKGNTGTANIIYSQWATLKYPVRDTLIDGSHLRVSEIVAPKLTSAILNQGLIMVYMRFSNTTYALPYISDAGSKPSEINYRSVTGKIFITRFAFDDSGSVNMSGSLQFRYVLVPGGIEAAAQSGINLYDYTEVKQAFGLSD